MRLTAKILSIDAWTPRMRHTASSRCLVGMFPEDAAGAAGRDLTLRDGAQTPVQSCGGGALATPRPSNRASIREKSRYIFIYRDSYCTWMDPST